MTESYSPMTRGQRCSHHDRCEAIDIFSLVVTHFLCRAQGTRANDERHPLAKRTMALSRSILGFIESFSSTIVGSPRRWIRTRAKRRCACEVFRCIVLLREREDTRDAQWKQFCLHMNIMEVRYKLRTSRMQKRGSIAR